MYLEHFGLKDFPFAITPGTEFFFASKAAQEAFNTLRVAVMMGEGFMKVTGEVGTGKSMLCRKLIGSLEPDRYAVAYILNPYLEPLGLFIELAAELGLERPADGQASQHQVVDALTKRVLELNQQGKRVVICLDEAQAMPIETLEALRLLTNLETEKHKLLQVIIFGQPELDEKLNHPSVRQLRQRITYQYQLKPLSSEEFDYYIYHRLAVAGYGRGKLFTTAALQRLERDSQRTPRLINILANKALLSAYGKGKRLVELEDVKTAAADTGSIAVQDSIFSPDKDMSLINQMLRDLEQRDSGRRSTAATDAEAGSSSSEPPFLTTAVPVPSRDELHDRRKPWLLSALGLAALLAVGGSAWWLGRGTQTPPPAAVASSEPAPQEAAPVRPEPSPAPVVAAAAAPEPASPPAKLDPVQSKLVDSLLRVAPPVPPPVKALPPEKTAAAQPADPAKPAQAKDDREQRAENAYRRARELFAQGQGDAANQALREALEIWPQHVEARLSLGRQLIGRKQNDVAANVLADGIMLQPQETRFALLLAPLWFQAGQQDDAFALLAQGARSPSVKPEFNAYYATQLLRVKRHQEAVAQFQAAVRGNPAQPDWLIGLGLSLQALGQHREAIEALQRADETGKLSAERKNLVANLITDLKSRL